MDPLRNVETGQYFTNTRKQPIFLKNPEAKKLFAILWAGQGNFTHHFHDINEVRKAILDQWDEKDVEIVILFGNGKTRVDGAKNVPLTEWKAREATTKNLKDAISDLKKGTGQFFKGRVTAQDQFFFYATGHGGIDVDPRPRQAAANAPNRSVVTFTPRQIQGMTVTPDNVPTVAIQQRQVASPNLAVRLNGFFLGHIDPLVDTTTFAVPQEAVGTCGVLEIQSEDPREDYTYETAVTFSPGAINPIFLEGAELPQPEVCPDVTLLRPFAAIKSVGTAHRATLKLVDETGVRIDGRRVIFEVTSGPNAGVTGETTTDSKGEAMFKYNSNGELGLDEMLASFVDSRGITQFTNIVTVEWSQPSVVTKFEGHAKQVGVPDGGAEVKIQGGRFVFDGAVDLSGATVRFTNLLNELGGSGELVSNVPFTLLARRGSRANAAIFESSPGERPQRRLEIRTRREGVFDFSYKEKRGNISVNAQRCEASEPTTNLITSFTIDDGVTPPLVLTTEAAWRCSRAQLRVSRRTKAPEAPPEPEPSDGENRPPKADFRADPRNGSAPLSVEFTNHSEDRDGQLAGFSWDFGDGTTSSEANPTHTYTTPGEFDVTLTVTDDNGATTTKTERGQIKVR